MERNKATLDFMRLVEGRQKFLLGTPDADVDAGASQMKLRSFLNWYTKLQGISFQCCLWAPEPPRPNALFDTFSAIGNPLTEIGPLIPFDPEVCIVLDYGDWNRVKEKGFPEFAVPHIGIDHHPGKPGFPGLEIIDLDAASTTCVLFDLLEDYRGYHISADVATCALAGLVADTGRFGNKLMKKPKIYRYAASFEARGARTAEISIASLPHNTLSRLDALHLIRESRLQIDRELDFAFFWFTPDDLRSWDVVEEDCLTMFSYLMDFGVITAYYMKDGAWYCSLRPGRNSKVSVGTIATGFGGGGHTDMAAFSTNLQHEEIFLKIKKILREPETT